MCIRDRSWALSKHPNRTRKRPAAFPLGTYSGRGSSLTRPLTESLWALRLAKPFDGKSPGARRISRAPEPLERGQRGSRS
eukprot:1215819-Pyramimonas_sp.AAC.1